MQPEFYFIQIKTDKGWHTPLQPHITTFEQALSVFHHHMMTTIGGLDARVWRLIEDTGRFEDATPEIAQASIRLSLGVPSYASGEVPLEDPNVRSRDAYEASAARGD